MAKLTLVVTHYREPIETCSFLFNSIDIQHGINKADIEVLLINDGEEGALTDEEIGKRSYEVRNIIVPHGGVSAARNYGIEQAQGEYIMFCDCDDGFIHNYGLHLVFSAMAEGFDVMNSSFIEEAPLDGGWKIFRRDKNAVFIHGKAYRKQFLLDNHLRFDTDLYFCEDSLFNCIAFQVAEKTKYIETPIYLWAWNDASTVRTDRENICIRKYDQIILMRTKAARELKHRGFTQQYKESICSTMADCYCDFQEPLFTKPGNKPWRERAEKEFKKFYREFSHDFMTCDSELIGKALLEARARAYENGYRVEQMDYKSWLKHIKNDISI